MDNLSKTLNCQTSLSKQKLRYIAQNGSYLRHEANAGIDIVTGQGYKIEPGTNKINSEIKLALPANTFAYVQPRSSAMKAGLIIQGLIDQDYHGPIYIVAHNITNKAIYIKPGTAIAQLVLHKYHDVAKYDILCCPVGDNDFKAITADSARGENAFGSTGMAI